MGYDPKYVKKSSTMHMRTGKENHPLIVLSHYVINKLSCKITFFFKIKLKQNQTFIQMHKAKEKNYVWISGRKINF